MLVSIVVEGVWIGCLTDAELGLPIDRDGWDHLLHRHHLDLLGHEDSPQAPHSVCNVGLLLRLYVNVSLEMVQGHSRLDQERGTDTISRL